MQFCLPLAKGPPGGDSSRWSQRRPNLLVEWGTWNSPNTLLFFEILFESSVGDSPNGL